MAARAKKRAAYRLLALVAVKVASSAPSPTITHGFASSDEMCLAYLAVTVPASPSYFDAQSLAVRGLPGAGGCGVQSFP